MKRVCCLYRVSTKGQVDKDDIPMQRQACTEFVKEQGWEIVSEVSEKGVSGYKVSSANRDAVLKIQADALLGKFDILLVFMFDRLGRRDDETPFVVEWFVKNGIEVWSTQEGQQKFDDHIDKLMNYIRYWQASGESLKISVRTKTRLAQLVKEGNFKGGTIPFGYDLVPSGRFNKKDHELMDIKVNDAETEVVRTIFSMTIIEGYGSHRLAVFLNKKGILTKRGNEWLPCSINNILKNRMYLGFLRCGDVTSDQIPGLQIIEDELFKSAQEVIQQRKTNFSEKRTVPLNTKSQSLLTGFIYCGHCGGRLVLTTNTRKRIDKAGNEKIDKRIKYACYNRTRKINSGCDGPSIYSMNKIDDEVSTILMNTFEKIKGLPEKETIHAKYDSQMKISQRRHTSSVCELNKAQAEIASLRCEVVKAIQGTSKFSPELINDLLETATGNEIQAEAELNLAKEELENKEAILSNTNLEFNKFLGWADVYQTASIEIKKMIVAKLIKRVNLKRDYEIDIEFNIGLEQYLKGL